MGITLPKEYLSYSQMTLWEKSPERYRMMYYHGEGKLDTPEIRFGKKISNALERRDDSVNFVKQYSHPEYEIKVEIEGIPILGYIDSFSKKHKRFLEYKTAQDINSWNAVKVAKHPQLDFYSLIIQESEGKVHDDCELIVIETASSDVEYKGHRFEPVDKGLRLTGKSKSYKRTIEQWERDCMKKRIIKVAKEISDDYKRFKEEEQFISGDF